VDLQLHYLEQAEAHLGAAFMPSWAREVSTEWRRTLEDLSRDPDSLGNRLDWAIKRRLYEHRAERKGLSWDSLGRWSRVAREISSVSGDTDGGEVLARVDLAQRSRHRNALLKRSGLGWEELERFLQMRRELLEIDIRFGELGPRGIFSSIDRAGVLDHRLPGLGSVKAAMKEPPSKSRAGLRGRLIRCFASRGDCYCDWSGVWDFGSNRVADLSDPFEQQEVWREVAERNSGTYSPSWFAARHVTRP